VSRAGLLLLVCCSGVVLLANIVLRAAMDRSQVKLFSGGLGGLPREVLALGLEPRFAMALGSYALAMLIWFRLIATEPLSVAYPALAALSFVAVSLAGVLVFGEPLSLMRAAGLICIVLGVCLVTLGP
jgi:multidrug transporter EmrE-like cation transporter